MEKNNPGNNEYFPMGQPKVQVPAVIFSKAASLKFVFPFYKVVAAFENSFFHGPMRKPYYLEQAEETELRADEAIHFDFKIRSASALPEIWVLEYAGGERINAVTFRPKDDLSLVFRPHAGVTHIKLAFRIGEAGIDFFDQIVMRPFPLDDPVFAFCRTEMAALLPPGSFKTLASLRESLRGFLLAQTRSRVAINDYPVCQSCREAAASGRDFFRQWLKNLRIATIMDEFSWKSFSPEADFRQITPENWRQELESFQPDVFLCESAWRGKDDLWTNTIHTVPDVLLEILCWCRSRQVPAIFWNKEDPAHFNTFIAAAMNFDVVATYDLDCIPAYKDVLGHEMVFFLPMGVQPRMFNPLEKYERKMAVCFAGAYYLQYLERMRSMDDFARVLPERFPLEIFDRNHGDDNPRYRFPDFYRQFILGKLPYDEIDKAYKGYRFAINMNSTGQSQTAMARRVFELMACNTTVISNYARGCRIFFGDLALTGKSAEDLLRRIALLEQKPYGLARHNLGALRKVMREDLYEDRLASLLCQMSQTTAPADLPPILAIGVAYDEDDAANIMANFKRQRHNNKKLLLVWRGQEPLKAPLPKNVFLQASMPLSALLFGVSAWVATMHPKDYYGAEYFTDLAISARYATFSAAGKGSWFVLEDKIPALKEHAKPYSFIGELAARRCIASPAWLAGSGLEVEELPEAILHGHCLAIDPFNYCQDGMAANVDFCDIDDLPQQKSIINANTLQELGRNMAAFQNMPSSDKCLQGEQLFTEFAEKSKNSKISISSLAEGGILLESTLQHGCHEYRNGKTRFAVSALLEPGSRQLKLYLDTGPELDVRLGYSFFDGAAKKILGNALPGRSNLLVDVPQGAETIQLHLRVLGAGRTQVRQLLFTHHALEPETIISTAPILVLTNRYPAYDDLYRNVFVHTRVRLYKEMGLPCDVFQLGSGKSLAFDEFENVDIFRGGPTALDKILQSGHVKTVLVHFFDDAMWNVLKKYISRLKIIIWVHGSDIHHWSRRIFNILDEKDFARIKEQSKSRMDFWKSFIKSMPKNAHLVFVSDYLARAVEDDYGLKLPSGKYSIVHNPIDTDFYFFRPKNPAQRFKILAIRPFTAPTYATDQIRDCILALSNRPNFDRYEFFIAGDGPLFDEMTRPLADFANVRLHKGYLTHAQIRRLHQDYGIFLVPTREDTQGVSRDEAMASGLVPVTTRVSAVPEFTDDQCAILAPCDDARALADGIELLAANPDLFVKMSAAAAQRVRAQSAAAKVIKDELTLINHMANL